MQLYGKDDAVGTALASAVLVVAWSAPTASLADLFPEERAAVYGAVPRRQREFATGRVCARAMLRRLGGPNVPILADERRRPIWPVGFVGSITHCPDACVAAVARCSAFAGVGIDVEPDATLDSELWEWICTDAELAWLQEQHADHRGRLARVLFSAKESTYKCLSPWLREPFEPRRIEIECDIVGGKFQACVGQGHGTRDGAAALIGSLTWRQRWMLSTMTLPAGTPGGPR
jgi:4'-phosphopantetheinyl transferase EntD